MTLDQNGVLVACSSCGTMNRLKYAGLERASKCGKCQSLLPFPAEPIEVRSAQLFDAVIAGASVPVVVDFWAVWCGPCHMMAPEVDKVAQRTAGRALVLKVDTDATRAQPALSNPLDSDDCDFSGRPRSHPRGGRATGSRHRAVTRSRRARITSWHELIRFGEQEMCRSW